MKNHEESLNQLLEAVEIVMNRHDWPEKMNTISESLKYLDLVENQSIREIVALEVYSNDKENPYIMIFDFVAKRYILVHKDFKDIILSEDSI